MVIDVDDLMEAHPFELAELWAEARPGSALRQMVEAEVERRRRREAPPPPEPVEAPAEAGYLGGSSDEP